ncbi:MAG: deoxyribonuclease IV [bacterium]
MGTKSVLLGAHTSISGGFYKSIEAGIKTGATAIQIFTKNNKSWAGKEITSEEINKFKETQKKSPIKYVVAHSSYLINIGSPNKETEEKSIESLEKEIKRCEQLEIPYLVIHPGARLKNTEEKCIQQIAKNLDIILKKCSGKTQILLETTAGQGTNIGYKFEHIKKIISLAKEKNKIGVCIDTCHVFAAGYDISTPSGYNKTMNEFSKTIGFKNLKTIHLNDSKTELGSKKDRHENIGKGKIPLKTFALIMNDPRFEKIPKILETPFQNIDEYAREIKLLKSLIK